MTSPNSISSTITSIKTITGTTTTTVCSAALVSGLFNHLHEAEWRLVSYLSVTSSN